MEAKSKYVDELEKSSIEDQLQSLKQFFIDMMDIHEQTDVETIFIDLHECLLKSEIHYKTIIELNKQIRNSKKCPHSHTWNDHGIKVCSRCG